jgi:hypothetical protein
MGGGEDAVDEQPLRKIAENRCQSSVPTLRIRMNVILMNFEFRKSE